jgi:CHASE1-domain containing sensor protein
MVRVPALSAILLISALTGVTLMTAQANDQLAPQTAVERLAERTIVCSRLRCWAIREGCRFVAAPHYRDNRIRCGPARPA